jgi:hypothetical protein
MKKFLIVLTFSLFALSVSAFVVAQERQLEVTYPEFFGTPGPGTVKTDIAQYFRYVYYAVLAIGGFIALGALVYGGFRYLTSVGSAAALQDAKDQILAALLGMLILFGSWLVLYALNPQLVALKEPILRPSPTTLSAGTWLCKEDKNSEFQATWQRQEEFRIEDEKLKVATTDKEKEEIINKLKALTEIIKGQMEKINEKCYFVAGSGGIRGDFTRAGNYITHIYFVPKKENGTFTNYGAILFKEADFRGGSKIIFDFEHKIPVGGSLSAMSNPFSTTNIPFEKPFSIMSFIINYEPLPEWKVIIYEEVDNNRGLPDKKKQSFPPRGRIVGLSSPLDFSPKSIEITHKPSYIAVLSKEATFTNPKIFIASDSNISGYDEIVDWEWGFCLTPWRCASKPAAKHIFLVSAKFY